MRKKSLLYKSGVEYADFCINHVLGCSHGCKYPCYAMMLARRFGKIKDYRDWRKPRIVTNALELLDKEIPKYKNQINFVHLSFMTDPFMYKQKEIGDLSLRIIEKLNINGIRSTSLTKGIYPKRLTNKKKYGKDNIYGITLVSLDEKFRKKFEPYSAPFKKRISALKYLSERGLRTWVSIEPYPTPNLVEQDFSEILDAVSFANRIIFGRLNYNVKSTQFKHNAEFYEYCVEELVKFCKKNRIEYHVKEGTQKRYAKKTERIFKNG